MPLKLPSFRARRDVYPPDLWTKCPTCSTMLFNKQLEKNLRVCTTCGHHFRLSAEARLEHVLDPGTWSERDPGLQSVDALGFVDQKPYPDRLAAAQLATGMRDAAVWGTGSIGGHEIAICVMDFGFMGGSMGAVVGEKVTRAAEHALAARVPLVVVSASGGARMQEGTLALMQLAKTLAALERLRASGVPFFSVLSDPTTGGVFASFAAVGDVNIAEPDALIGFAGARVTAGTIAAELPPGFQRAEFLFSHGFVDRVVPRPELHDELASLLRLLPSRGAFDEPEPEEDVPAFRPFSFLTTIADRVGELANGDGAADDDEAAVSTPPVTVPAVDPDGAVAIAPLNDKARDDVWARVQLARSLRRPRTLEFLDAMADEFVELHGDRLFGDDAAIVAGLARIGGRRVAVIGQQKGADTDENILRNFGMPHPEGYRKAMRVMELAERAGLPIVTFVDVPGAHPGPESEERGIAEAIARSIGLMSRLRTPIVTVITGEGGSGGALAIAVGDVVIALENAVYSVISPEGCASILWRTSDEAATAAAAMRMSAADQHALGVIDIVVPEPGEGAHAEPEATADRLRSVILDRLDALALLPIDTLLEQRYRRYRALGAYTEVARPEVPGRVDRSLADRLRDLLDPARRGLIGVEVWSRDDDPPAREEV
ncbi:MAG TPA: acetyl-CoA carboxylase carboxyltransferase subunit alpha [Candidatus Limnocylindrales bacterium]|nr:acetyl-CoA carboxylase carboxyltransferase subunit alpha [Candidatus Limnocylindrales bacterium]